MKGFYFKNGFMEEYFNENYVESEQYFKVVFKGDLVGFFDKEVFQKVGFWLVIVKGLFIFYGVIYEVIFMGSI